MAQAQNTTELNSSEINLGANTRIFQLKESVIQELPENLKYVRAYGADFSKKGLDQNGDLYRVDEGKIEQFIKLVTERNLKVIWIPIITKDGRTMESELQLIYDLKSRGVQFHAIQVFGEYYLPKYYKGDKTAKGVLERIRKEDLPPMLTMWIPAIKEALPELEIYITCASHQNGTSKAEKYRKSFTDTILKWAEAKGYDGGFCFHMYAGYKPQKGGNEETIYSEINFSHIVGQIKTSFPDAPIHLCEGGYYRRDDNELHKLGEFALKAQEALGEDGIVVLHHLQGAGEFAWYDHVGLTPAGDYIINDFFKEKIEEEQPTLINLTPKYSKGLPVMWGRQTLYFSNGDRKRIRVRFSKWRYGVEDIGKTPDELGIILG